MPKTVLSTEIVGRSCWKRLVTARPRRCWKRRISACSIVCDLPEGRDDWIRRHQSGPLFRRALERGTTLAKKFTHGRCLEVHLCSQSFRNCGIVHAGGSHGPVRADRDAAAEFMWRLAYGIRQVARPAVRRSAVRDSPVTCCAETSVRRWCFGANRWSHGGCAGTRSVDAGVKTQQLAPRFVPVAFLTSTRAATST